MVSRTLSVTAEELFPRNRLRKSFLIQNEDKKEDIFMKFERNKAVTVSSTDHDHRIGPGGAIAVNSDTDGKESIEDRVTVVAGAATPRVSFFETEDVVR